MIERLSDFSLVAAPWIFDAEGGFVNDAADRGGATKYGISLAFLRLLTDADGDGWKDGDLNRDGVVDQNDILWLDKPQAEAIYLRYFWDGARCGELPYYVALPLFDARVNHVPKVAALLVQRALRVTCDGVIGPQTIRAAKACDPDDFLSWYLAYRAQHFADIVRMDSTQARFELGWYRRLMLLHNFVFALTLSL